MELVSVEAVMVKVVMILIVKLPTEEAILGTLLFIKSLSVQPLTLPQPFPASYSSSSFPFLIFTEVALMTVVMVTLVLMVIVSRDDMVKAWILTVHEGDGDGDVGEDGDGGYVYD